MAELCAPALSSEQLWRDEYVGLVRCAWLLTGSLPDAEDAVHDAWLTCRERLTTVTNPGAYLRRAVINACHGRQRRRLVEDRAYRKLDSAEWHTADHLVEFHDALHRLDLRSRTVVVMRLFCQDSDADIAAVLGCQQSTVRVIFHRAMRSLRKVLQ